MPTSHQIVTEINAFLDGAEVGGKEALARLAAAYASACREANERLVICGNYLRRSLRSEAIALAQVEPDLIETVTTLDLPRIDEWIKVCQGAGLSRPPRLVLDLA